jgi:hypothetical protein
MCRKVENPERYLRELDRRTKIIFKLVLRKEAYKFDLNALRYGPILSLCEHGNEPSVP